MELLLATRTKHKRDQIHMAMPKVVHRNHITATLVVLSDQRVTRSNTSRTAIRTSNIANTTVNLTTVTNSSSIHRPPMIPRTLPLNKDMTITSSLLHTNNMQLPTTARASRAMTNTASIKTNTVKHPLLFRPRRSEQTQASRQQAPSLARRYPREVNVDFSVRSQAAQ